MEGRDLTWGDLFNDRSAVIVNETVARKLWPGKDPIGRTAIAGGQEAQVIGVIADVHETGAEDNPGAQMYLPATKRWHRKAAIWYCVRNYLPRHWQQAWCALYVTGIPDNRRRNSSQSRRWSTTRRLPDVFCPAGRILCRSGTSPRFARDLWSHFVFRDAANAGDWCPHGSRCDAVLGANRRDSENVTAHADRHGGWNHRRTGACTPYCPRFSSRQLRVIR